MSSTITSKLFRTLVAYDRTGDPTLAQEAETLKQKRDAARGRVHILKYPEPKTASDAHAFALWAAGTLIKLQEEKRFRGILYLVAETPTKVYLVGDMISLVRERSHQSDQMLCGMTMKYESESPSLSAKFVRSCRAIKIVDAIVFIGFKLPFEKDDEVGEEFVTHMYALVA